MTWRPTDARGACTRENSDDKSEQMSRRDVLAAGKALAWFAFLPSSVLGRGDGIAPNDRVSLAYVGIGGMYGARAFQELSGHNIVCDVDWRQVPNRPSVALQTVAKYGCETVRRLAHHAPGDGHEDRCGGGLLGRSHARPPVHRRHQNGKHVYCEKPLAHPVGEVKAMMAAERKYKVSTQMGIQGHASDDASSMVEWIRDGAIGTVKEVHLFDGARPTQPGGGTSPRSGRGACDNIQRVTEEIPIQPEVQWDLWLGAAPARPYNPMYLQGARRRWLDFGTGPLGDHGSPVTSLSRSYTR